MCYMGAAIERVGVRELRQNLSVHLRKVIYGRTLEVTDRGVAVAILAPLPPAASVLERLIAEGRATPPHGDLLDLRRPPMKMLKASRRASRALERERADRRL
jgi:antitoxin (DNA-binding transcriptional repressor) of toxin-antitoxin stability system